MKKNKSHVLTSFQLSPSLHTQLKMMCILTEKSMGEFIRIAISDKIKQIKEQKVK
jgi:hypothetical protein